MHQKTKEYSSTLGGYCHALTIKSLHQKTKDYSLTIKTSYHNTETLRHQAEIKDLVIVKFLNSFFSIFLLYLTLLITIFSFPVLSRLSKSRTPLSFVSNPIALKDF